MNDEFGMTNTSVVGTPMAAKPFISFKELLDKKTRPFAKLIGKLV